MGHHQTARPGQGDLLPALRADRHLLPVQPSRMISPVEDSLLAADFIEEASRPHGAAPHPVLADRGTSMTSKPVSALLADLGVTRSHTRPHVSDDNPFPKRSSRPSSTCRMSPPASDPSPTRRRCGAVGWELAPAAAAAGRDRGGGRVTRRRPIGGGTSSRAQPPVEALDRSKRRRRLRAAGQHLVHRRPLRSGDREPVAALWGDLAATRRGGRWKAANRASAAATIPSCGSLRGRRQPSDRRPSTTVGAAGPAVVNAGSGRHDVVVGVVDPRHRPVLRELT